MKKLSLTTWILIATVGGIVFGTLIGPWAGNLKFIGDIFIRLIQMSVVLLVMTSVMTAVAEIDGKSAGKMGLHTFKWVVLFTLFAAFLGLVLGLLIKPGLGIAIPNSGPVAEPVSASLTQTLLDFVPSNIVNAMANGAMIPCILFSIIFGFALGTYTRSSQNRIVIDFITGFNRTVINVIQIVMNVAPIGIFCLLANVSGAIGFAVVGPMLKFLGCLLIGTLIQILIYFPMTAALCKVSVLKMPKKFMKMSIMALTTTSSAICLPTQMEDMYTKFGMSRRATEFVGPIAMSMNSSGAVQCYVLAILFVSQASGIELTTTQLGMAILLSFLMCMGTIVVPGGMVITYTFLAASLGLPLESVAVLIGIDWFSGMFRTLLNVDVDVLVGMLVSDKLGELDRDVYNGKKIVEYVQ